MINSPASFGNAIVRLGKVALWTLVIGISAAAIAATVLSIEIGALNQSLFPSLAVAAIVFALAAFGFRLAPRWIEARTASRAGVEFPANSKKRYATESGYSGSADDDPPTHRIRSADSSRARSIPVAKARRKTLCPRIRAVVIEDIK